MQDFFTFKVQKSDKGKRLDKFLSEKLQDLSRSRIKRLILDGQVRIENKVVLLPKKKLQIDQEISITIPKPKPLELTPKKLNIDVIFEDEHLIIINKPAGIVVHPGAGNLEDTLVHGLLAICKNLSGIGGIIRPGIVHRLDKDTSGIMVVAKHDNCHKKLTEMFKNRAFKKSYHAIVKGGFSDMQGIIDLPIGRHPYKRTKMAVNFKNGKEAKTSFKVISSFGNFQHLSLGLLTGRTHQIRVHLSHYRCPILGDTTYGGPRFIEIKGQKIEIKRQMLHAYKIEFNHPITDKKMAFTAPLPKDFLDVIEIISR